METLIATIQVKENIAVEERLALIRILNRSGLIVRMSNDNKTIELLVIERNDKPGLDIARH